MNRLELNPAGSIAECGRSLEQCFCAGCGRARSLDLLPPALGWHVLIRGRRRGATGEDGGGTDEETGKRQKPETRPPAP